MDQIRLILAIALSFLVFIVWNLLFVDKKKVEQPKPEKQAEQIIKEDLETPPKAITDADTIPLGEETPLQPGRPAKTITVNLPLYTVKISEKGAVFKSFVLKKYRERLEADSPHLELISPNLSGGTVRLGFVDNSLVGFNEAIFAANIEDDAIDVTNEPRELSFSWASPKGVVVVKKFSFSPSSYLIGLTVIVKNSSNQTVQDNLVLSLSRLEPEKTTRIGFEGPCAFINNELEQIKTKKIKDKSIYSGQINWISILDRYFMAAIIPEAPIEASMRLNFEEKKLLQNQLVPPVSVIEPETQNTFKYQLFFGPKSMNVLKDVGYNLNKAVNFGMFDFLAKPFVWIMNFIYNFIPNYGIAIIILTLITKIILWPLGNKSYKSMNEMKKIQPLVAEIREKYKDDKKRMNEEMMGLYKTYKVNPAGGCLPMVVQIPVFFALYRMLYEAIELRHAPFFLWITDLSAPDRLFRFSIENIPFMQPPYGIPVLTIIMGATMFLQQKMQPPAGDPTQAKMMMMMPIVFTVIFVNFSSGLVLYWLVNNIISIGQQYYISKKKA
ncbi:MAG: membrane protein insertase YidC [Desulfobacterales bacterium]|nr:MAG: membrane protein insertase YidC [Desulfobacterales bacterium]